MHCETHLDLHSNSATSPIIFYHANCSDGFASAVVAWLKLSCNAEYIALEAHVLNDCSGLSLLPEIVGRELYFLDLVVPPEVAERLSQKAKNVCILDHHQTSFKVWRGIDTKIENKLNTTYKLKFKKNTLVILNSEKSGALIAWDYFFPGVATPNFLAYIDDYDRHAFKLPLCTDFNLALLNVKPWTFTQWAQFIVEFGDCGSTFGERLVQFLSIGTMLSRTHAMHVDAIASTCTPCEIKGLSVSGKAVCCPLLYANDVGRTLAAVNSFVLCWHGTADGDIKCSLRSTGEFDVGHLAEAYGGGGHRFSAAFRLSHGEFIKHIKLGF